MVSPAEVMLVLYLFPSKMEAKLILLSVGDDDVDPGGLASKLVMGLVIVSTVFVEILAFFIIDDFFLAIKVGNIGTFVTNVDADLDFSVLRLSPACN